MGWKARTDASERPGRPRCSSAPVAPRQGDRICRVERRRDFTWCRAGFMRPPSAAC